MVGWGVAGGRCRVWGGGGGGAGRRTQTEMDYP